eukprot:ANDGO_08335.mRNA.1 33 kDa inner dynein arm light chain
MSAPSSLVKYNNPMLLSEARKKALSKGPASGPAPSTAATTLGSTSRTAGGAKGKPSALPPMDASTGAPKGVSLASVSALQTEDILNAILPPREWDESGQKWVQHVSATPATRADVIHLQEQLDKALQLRQARETGICPVREELYAQSFDEIIRQVTINCAERGLLLLRIRDELRMTIAAYRTLYESSVAFGMRKALLSEQGKLELADRNKDLEGQVAALQRQAKELQAKLEATEKREAERRAAEEKKYTDEIAFLKKTNQQLKNQLDSLLAPQQKKA